MKKSLLTVALALGVVGAYGQGSIQFNNFTSGSVTAPAGKFPGVPFEVSVYWVSGTFAGTAAQLISGGTYQDISAPMFGAGPLLENDQNNGAGFFDGGVVSITGAATAGTYSFVVVAYSGAGTYSAALANPLSYVGNSSVFQVNLVTGATPPGTISLPTFQVNPVPEPSTFALAGLGLAGLLIFRRRK